MPPHRLAVVRPVVHHPVVLVFIAALVFAVLSAAGRALRRASAPHRAPAPAELLRETILVVLVVAPGTGRLVTRHVFEAASVPSRVFLAVYADRSRVQCTLSTQSHVRIGTDPRKHAFDEARARAWAASHLHRHEVYTLLVPADVQLAAGWDEALVAMHRALPHPGTTLLTSHCSPLRDRALPAQAQRARFLCVGDAPASDALHLSSRLVAEAPRPGVPSLFWSPGLSFGLGAALRDVPLWPGATAASEEAINSARLWTHGYDFVVPCVVVAWAPPRRNGATPAGARVGAELEAALGHARRLEAYAQYTGLRAAGSPRRARARAFAGLTSVPSVDECRCKFGSVEAAHVASGEGVHFCVQRGNMGRAPRGTSGPRPVDSANKRPLPRAQSGGHSSPGVGSGSTRPRLRLGPPPPPPPALP